MSETERETVNRTAREAALLLNEALRDRAVSSATGVGPPFTKALKKSLLHEAFTG